MKLRLPNVVACTLACACAAQAQLNLPFEGSATSSNAAFKVTNTGSGAALHGTSNSGTAVVALSTLTTPNMGSYGIWAESASQFGAGVFGLSTSPDGVPYGVYGESISPFGSGVFGYAAGTGGYFISHGEFGSGVSGQGFVGGSFSSNDLTSGWGVSASGAGVGGFFSAFGAGGTGVIGNVSSENGSGVGGSFSSAGATGIGVQADVSQPGAVALRAQNSGGGLSGDFFGPVAVESYSLSTPALSVLSYNAVAAHFDSRVAIGTTTTNAGLHVRKEPNTLEGTLALEGTTHTFMSFYPDGFAAGRKGFIGFPGATINDISVTNQINSGNITLTPGAGGAVLASSTGSYALRGRNDSNGNYGLLGTPSYGVHGVLSSTLGSAVRGEAGVGRGGDFTSTSTAGIGVYAAATATTGYTYGVYGRAYSSNGYGVYSAGRFAASGTKSFQIDHPLDPENKYLNHYCAEGPEPLNVYRGNVTLDADGEAWVELPDYFGEINRDPSYQLTAVGAAAPNLHVAEAIADNRFLISGGRPGLQVSWRVEAVRHDPYVRTYGAPTEVAKPAEMLGTYLHPELYGQPPEAGQFYRAQDAEAATEPGQAGRSTGR